MFFPNVKLTSSMPWTFVHILLAEVDPKPARSFQDIVG